MSLITESDRLRQGDPYATHLTLVYEGISLKDRVSSNEIGIPLAICMISAVFIYPEAGLDASLVIIL